MHTGEAEVYFQTIRSQALEGGGWLATLSGRFTSGVGQVSIVQKAGPVWTTF